MASNPENDDDYRLPRHAIPERYSLRIAPSIESGQFAGDVAIRLRLLETADSIVLNALDLEISAAVVVSAEGTSREVRVEIDRAKERAVFLAPEPLPAGEYVLRCDFSGPIGRTLQGFYASDFLDEKGATETIVSTHFEPTDARRAFPCFDEPDLKAVFSITLDVPPGLECVSNSPEESVTRLEDGTRRVRFSDTMVMSTYLVAWAIGPFEVTEPVSSKGVPIRVFVPRGKLELTAFGLEAATHAVAWFTDYFALSYPAEKLDLVAIPDFAAGAMENLGCVTFREADLLCNPAQSSIPELSRIAEVVEHEIAHMWFGDLVTMRWWNGVWLNEAFATFMSLLCLDDFRPEWNRWAMFGAEKDASLQTDGLHSTRPIEFPVRSPEEADAMFDALTYLKGGSVLRMMQQYLGPDRFREGVRQYLRRHAYGNTETTDLWDSIEAVSEGEPVRAVFDSWVLQGGHPLVTVGDEGGRVSVTAEAFSYLPEPLRPTTDGPSGIGHEWFVPILYEDRPGPREGLLLSPGSDGSMRAELPEPERLLVLNAGGSGTYRLRYEGAPFEQLLVNLAELEPLERFNLVADSFAATLSLRAGLDDYLALVRRLEGETDPNVWGSVSTALHYVDLTAAGVAEDVLARFVSSVARGAFELLGFDPHVGDSPEHERARSILIGLLGTVGGDEAVKSGAVERFRAAAAGGAPLPASSAAAILRVVARGAARDDFEVLLEGYRHPVDPQSEDRHLAALTQLGDPALAGEVLEMTREEMRAQDVPVVLRRMLANRSVAREVWPFVTAHLGEIGRRLPAHSVTTIVTGVGQLVAIGPDGAEIFGEEVRRFVESQDFGGRRRLVDQALERREITARFAVASWPGIRELLEKA